MDLSDLSPDGLELLQYLGKEQGKLRIIDAVNIMLFEDQYGKRKLREKKNREAVKEMRNRLVCTDSDSLN